MIDTRAILPSIATGSIIGLGTVIWVYTLAALIFSGDLEIFMLRGAGFILMGAAMLIVVMALTSSYSGTIGDPDEIAGVILSIIASTIVLNTPGISKEAAFSTVVVVIVISTFLSGLVFFSLGYFRFGNLIRYVPYPVIGGVIVVMGWVLIEGGVTVMTEIEEIPSNLSFFLDPAVFYKLLSGVVFAVLLMLGMHLWDHALVLPGLFMLAIIGFHVFTGIAGYSVADLQASGWLLGPFPDAGIWEMLSWDYFERANMALITEAAPDLAALILLCTLNLLLGATAMEVAVKRDVDLNKELKSSGLANMLSALFGGITGSHSIEDPIIAKEMGSTGRLLGLIVAAVCVLALVFGASLFSYIPKFLLGGFVLFFGILLLVEWLYDGWSKLPKTDYLVIVLCLLVSINFGYLEGIGFGIVAGIVIFVVEYSHIEAIRNAVSGSVFHSNVERDKESTELLVEHGQRIYVLHLQGFIFFGTAHKIYRQVKERVIDETQAPLSHILIDLRSVSGVDSSATSSFLKMRQLAKDHNFFIAVTSVGERVSRSLEKTEFLLTEDERVVMFSDLDRGIEWCEDRLLESFSRNEDSKERSLFDSLHETCEDRGAIDTLLTYLEPQQFSSGEVLIQQGGPSNDMYFIETGRVSVHLDLPDGSRMRLRSMGAGTIVGEMALYLQKPRSASVVAVENSRVYRISQQSLTRMKQENPAVYAIFSEIIIRLLANRLAEANNMLGALTN